ncbi:MAG: DNA repair protein RecO [Nitrospirota bacterium]
MAIFRTQGIVLRSIEYGEADLIITFFTFEKGRLKGLAKGCRRTKSRFGSSFEPFTHTRLGLYGRENTSLFRVTQSDIIHSFHRLRDDMVNLGYASYMSDLIDESSPECEPNHELFTLFIQSLRFIESGEEPDTISKIFQIKLLNLLGYRPEITRCNYCGSSINNSPVNFYPSHGGAICDRCRSEIDGSCFIIGNGTTNFFHKAIEIEVNKINRLKLTPQIKMELNSALLSYFSYILGRRPRSYSVLEQLERRDGCIA